MATSTWLLLCCLMLTCYVQDSMQLRLKNIVVPPVVKNDVESVILDCDYDFGNTSHNGFVMKWFRDDLLISLWIFGSKPEVEKEFKNYVDMNYTASNNPYTMYRALKFVRPGIRLTGTYKCLISVFETEVEGSSKMVVYSTEDKFDLVLSEKNQSSKDRLEATCMAEGLYPEPTMDISIGQLENLNVNVNSTLREDHKFNVYSRVTVDEKDLPESAIIKCSLSIPDANYTVFRETVYYSGPPLTTTSIPMIKMLPKTEIQAPNDTLAGVGNVGGGSPANSLSTSLIFFMGQLLIFAATIL